MIFLIIAVVIFIVGFMVLRQLDQYRWRRYAVERENYFQNHPLQFQGDGLFNINLPLDRHVQIKLINTFMWKQVKQHYLKKVLIQKEEQRNIHMPRVKVILEHIELGYLDQHYAQQLCQSLSQTDFNVGRPIEVLSEIHVLCDASQAMKCKISVDLPKDVSVLINALH